MENKVYGIEDVENEKYLMFDCSTKLLKDLKPGDLLMGADSKPCEILNIIQNVEENNYLVTPVKGDSYIVGESHTLAVNISSEKSLSIDEKTGNIRIKWFNRKLLKIDSKRFPISKYDKSKTKTYNFAKDFFDNLITIKKFGLLVKEYIKTDKNVKHIVKGYKVPLNFEDKKLDIDPYILGAWLGDGTSRDPNITTIDNEIITYFKNYFEPLGLKVNKLKKEITYSITKEKEKGVNNKGKNFFRTFLNEKNLIENKHIPFDYIENSRENRLKLLAGLLDTDGSLQRGCFDFVQKNEKLFDEFIFLCRSLGFSCYKKETQKTCTNNGVVGNYFRCCVSGNGLEEIPTLLERKKANKRKQIKDVLVTGIELQKIDSFPTYRIITDKPLFLMADFTVRHSWVPTLRILK